MEDQLLNIKLVQEIEKYPMLYNYNLPEYSRRDIIENTWAEVGKTVNLTGNQCREKWKNLRAVFVRQYKRNHSGIKGKKPYYLMNYMQFTLPFVKTLHNLRESEQYDNPDNSVDDEENEEADPLLSMREERSYLSHYSQSPYQTYAPQVNMSFSPKSSVPYTSSPQSNESDETPVKKAEKRKNSEVTVGYSNEKDKKIAKKELAEDHRKMFLLSLQPDITIMSDTQMRTFKRRVLAVIDDILQETPSTSSHSHRPELPIIKNEALDITNEQNDGN